MVRDVFFFLSVYEKHSSLVSVCSPDDDDNLVPGTAPHPNPKTQNPNPNPKPQNPNPKTPKPKTQNPNPKTQNPKREQASVAGSLRQLSNLEAHILKSTPYSAFL